MAFAIFAFSLCADQPVINSQLQCLLSMRVFPLEYIEKTNTMETKVHFESNCMPYPHAQYFVIPFKKYDAEMSLAKHPRTLELIVMDEKYKISFQDPDDLPDKKWMDRTYWTMTVSPSNFSDEPINLKNLNSFLITKGGNKVKPFFKKSELISVWNSINPCNCTVEKLEELICTLVPGEQIVQGY